MKMIDIENIEKIKPYGNRVLLKQDRIRQQGKILISADSAEKESFAEVIAVGPDVSSVKKGDIVFSDIYAGTVLYDDDVTVYSIVNEDDILAVKSE